LDAVDFDLVDLDFDLILDEEGVDFDLDVELEVEVLFSPLCFIDVLVLSPPFDVVLDLDLDLVLLSLVNLVLTMLRLYVKVILYYIITLKDVECCIGIDSINDLSKSVVGIVYIYLYNTLCYILFSAI